MAWFAFMHGVLLVLYFISNQCEGAITSPPAGKKYLFLPGQSGEIKWEFDDMISTVVLRSWFYKNGSYTHRLATIIRNGTTDIETKLYEIDIKKPATLVLKNVNQSYNGVYQFGLSSTAAFTSDVEVSIASATTVELSCPSHNEVDEGKNFTCVCRGEGGVPAPANVTWNKDGVQIRKTKKENNILTLTNVNVTDSGTYKCVARSYLTAEFEDEKSIKVIVRPNSKPNNTNVTFTQQPAMVGSSVETICFSEGVPDPHFTILRPNGEPNITGKSFKIDIVDKTHEGPYTCIATNTLGEQSATDNLTVKVKPIVTLSCPNRNEVKEGDDVICICKGEGGYPPADVTWYKEYQVGVQIGETKKGKNTLSLTDVNSTHGGTYKCVAQSYPTAAFKDEKSIELIVTCNCKTFLNDNSCGTEWYIVVVSLVSGILVGIFFSYIVWCSHRRWFRNEKSERNREPQAAEVDTTYQELDLSKMNKEDNYQSLRVNAASNDTGNDEDSTYTQLNKNRDVENNYQFLN